jgi:hypothetical protein
LLLLDRGDGLIIRFRLRDRQKASQEAEIRSDGEFCKFGGLFQDEFAGAHSDLTA